jgi:hypothetical protein
MGVVSLLVLSAGVCLLLAAAPATAQTKPASRPPLDFKVLKVDQPLTGLWEFASPEDGSIRRLEIKDGGAGDGVLVGTLVPEGTQVLRLTPKTDGIGYRGEIQRLLVQCGQERVAISDFVPFGDRILLHLDTRPAQIPCPFLENPSTARYFIAATVNPVRLRGAGEITSERTREQIGLGGQPGGPSNPIVSDAVSVEGGTEMRYKGRIRSLDGSVWVEVEGIVSPAVGAEPPRGFLLAENLRVSATLTLSRPKPSGAKPDGAVP